MSTNRVRERKLRVVLAHRGLALRKSPSRNPDAPEWGTYMVVDPRLNAVVASGFESGYGMTLGDVERFAREEGLLGQPVISEGNRWRLSSTFES